MNELILLTPDQLRAIVREEVQAALSSHKPTKAHPLGKRLSRQEAADFLGIAPKTLDAWALDSKVPYRRNTAGKRVYFLGDLEAAERGEIRGGFIGMV